MADKIKYLHGFTKEEQNRLYFQSHLLKDFVFRDVDFYNCKKIIEIGCGVGAQTEILLEKFPHLEIYAIDASKKQLARAKERFSKNPRKKQVHFIQGDAKNLKFDDNSFDAAFICWVLEHIPGPMDVVQEAHRVLRQGGKIFCNEVLNNTFFVEPYSSAAQKYLFEFNDYQWSIGGDPFVGAKLGAFLDSSKFKNIFINTVPCHFDQRMPKMRKDFIDLWEGIFISAMPELLKLKKITSKDISELKKELSALKKNKNSIIYWCCIQAFGVK